MCENLVPDICDISSVFKCSVQRSPDTSTTSIVNKDILTSINAICDTSNIIPISAQNSLVVSNHVSSFTNENHNSKNKKSIQFSDVTTYSFERQQGFSSVPDSGWCTLGMAQKHFSVSRLHLQQHCLLQKLKRKRKRMENKQNVTLTSNALRLRGRGRGRSKQLDVVLSCLSPGDSRRVPAFLAPPILSPQLHKERFRSELMFGTELQSTPPPPCLSPPSPGRLCSLDDSVIIANSISSVESLDTDSEASLDQIPSISLQLNRVQSRKTKKLMPIQPNARIRLLRSSGVSNLDESERLVCSYLRATRSRVGCDCGPRNSCIPGLCSCLNDEVPCQIDRTAFPCSCRADCCKNPFGRNEFSHDCVRAHVRRVLTRLKDELPVEPSKSPPTTPSQPTCSPGIVGQTLFNSNGLSSSPPPPSSSYLEGDCGAIVPLKVKRTLYDPVCSTPIVNHYHHQHDIESKSRQDELVETDRLVHDSKCKALHREPIHKAHSIANSTKTPLTHTPSKPSIADSQSFARTNSHFVDGRRKSMSHDSLLEFVGGPPSDAVGGAETNSSNNNDDSSGKFCQSVLMFSQHCLKKDIYASKSVPNSPTNSFVPFGRISLRRRAIPRVPVTPSRRLFKSVSKAPSPTSSNCSVMME